MSADPGALRRALVAGALLLAACLVAVIGLPQSPAGVSGAMGGVLLLVALAIGGGLVRAIRRLGHDRAEAAKALAECRERLESIAFASGGWAWETDTAGRITYCCSGAGIVIGHVPGGIPGKTFAELGFHPSPEAGKEPGRICNSETVLTRPGESPRRFTCSAVTVRDANGGFAGLRGICRDITETEREAGKLRALEENVSQADKAGMLDYVVSGIAHELNQPLAAVSAYCNASLRLLRQNPGSIDEVLTALAAAANQAKSASLVVKRMRGFMMRREPKVSVSSLDALVSDALALASIRLQQDGARVECEIGTDLPQVRVDTILMVQVILNLLYNALDAMAERTEKVVRIVAREEADGWVEVSISDNGTGITEDKLAQVFNPYFTTKPDGLGLGLPICMSILEAHGSTLVLEPNPAGGCTARFRLEQEGLV